MDPSRGSKFGQVPDDVKAKYLADLQGLPQLAADAQNKMPKMFMVAVERATNPALMACPNDDASYLVSAINLVSQSECIDNDKELTSQYTSVQVFTAQAAQDRFMTTPHDISGMRDRITSITNRFSNWMSELLSNPESAPSLTRLLAAVESGPSSVGAPSAPRQSPAMEDLASKLPKGLRVEDLKPPPSKRQKGKSGQSPAVQTPDNNPKTPSNLADSPANIPGSGSKKPTNTTAAGNNNKRKRNASNAAAIKTPKFVAPAIPKTESVEESQHRAFFEAQLGLANGTADPWAAIASAIEEFEKAQAEDAARSVPVVKPAGSSAATTNTSNAKANTTTEQRPGLSDDELFAEFLDLDATYFPTPELLSDILDDDSPESIRTVGRGESIVRSVRAAPVPLLPEVKPKEDQDQSQNRDTSTSESTLLTIPQSPASAAYNGGLVFQ